MSKTKETKNKFVKHIRDHKSEYITGAICLTVGALGSAALVMSRPYPVDTTIQQAINGVSWKPVMLQFVERSTPSKPIHKVGTKEYYESVHDAARLTGHDRSLISKNAHGQIPDVKGDRFEFVFPEAA